MAFARFRPAVVVALALCACQSNHLHQTTGGLVVPDGGLSFPDTWVGYPSRVALAVTNTAPQDITVATAATVPFSTAHTVTVAAGGAAAVTVEFAPLSEGPASGELSLSSGDRTFTVTLSGVGHVPPVCTAPADCESIGFEVDAGGCVTRALPDGSPCGASQLCLSNATCQSGLCLGGSTDCDDNNVCTIDACDPTRGCLHLDQTSMCPAATEVCEVATCDPQSGCGVGPAPDGTLCGSFSCAISEVCLQGSCLTAPTPQGAPCSPDLPCQGHGSCDNGACVMPDAGTLEPIWTYSTSDGSAIVFDGLLDGDSNVYWLECLPQSCTLVSSTLAGYQRFRTPMAFVDGGLLAGAGALTLVAPALVYVSPTGAVFGIEPESGSVAWVETVSGRTSGIGCGPLPDGGTVNLALGIPVAMGSASGDGGLIFIPATGAPGSASACDAGSWIVTLNASTGALASTTALEAPISSLVTDGHGQQWASSVPTLLGLTSNQSLPVGASFDLRAAFNGWLYLAESSSTVALETDDGGLQDLGLLSAPMGSDGIALGPTGGYVLGVANTDAGTRSALVGLDPASAELGWALVLEPGTAVTSPLITSRSTALLFGGPDGGPSPWMTEVDPMGDVPYVCELPPGTPTDVRTAALGIETVFLQVAWTDGGTQLEAFSATGVSPGSAGWVAPRGSSSRRGAPLVP